MSDRRYTKDEIKAIFEEAANAQETARRTSQQDEGLTLEELQAIGAESGITPEFIARAAARLGRALEGRLEARSSRGSLFRRVELPGQVQETVLQLLHAHVFGLEIDVEQGAKLPSAFAK